MTLTEHRAVLFQFQDDESLCSSTQASSVAAGISVLSLDQFRKFIQFIPDDASKTTAD
jgi:hypothetical protein